MDSANTFVAVLNNTAFLLCVLFTSYILSILRPFLRCPEVRLGDRTSVDWHVLIPCLNEQTVLADTVNHLVRTFGEATIWIVDDASDDSTPAIAAWLARTHPNVRVVTRQLPHARAGKGAALNAGWRQLGASLPAGADRDRVVVGVLDADGRLAPQCPDVITGPEMFGDPTVGAVQVQVRVSEDVDSLVAVDLRQLHGGRPRSTDDRLLIQLQDLDFAGPIAAMQFFRRRTGSVAMGGNGQFTRLSALDRVAARHGTPWHGALLEDFELGLHVLLTGFRSEYCHETFVAQSGLTTVRSLLRQRTRWSQGNIQCLKYLWQVTNSPRIQLSGALEIAYYMYIPFSQVLGSVVFPLTALVHLRYALAPSTGPDRWLLSGAWGLIPLALLFGVLPHALWGFFYRSHCASLVTRRRAVWMAVVNIGYSFLLQAAAWRAFYRVLRGRGNWVKTLRTADEQPTGPTEGLSLRA